MRNIMLGAVVALATTAFAADGVSASPFGRSLNPGNIVRDLGREATNSQQSRQTQDRLAQDRGAQDRRAQGRQAVPAQSGNHRLIQIANGPMQQFPFIGMPYEYTNRGRGEDKKDLARFPFFDGQKSIWIEGRFYGTPFVPIPGKSMSSHEVNKYFETLVTDMGGRKIWTGKVPPREIHYWGDEIRSGWRGRGDIYNRPVTIFHIPRTDGDLWIQLVTNSAQGWYLVGQGYETER